MGIIQSAFCRLVLLLFLVGALSIWIDAGAVGERHEVWLAPQTTAIDLKEMFGADAPWQGAASKTNVFKFYGNKFIIPIEQDELNKIVADLNRRGIAIAIETGVMNVGWKPRPPCGGTGYVEGYSQLPMHEMLVKKIKQAGGRISYIAMDEPLFYGHYFNGSNGGQPGCHSNFKAIAKLMAPSLKVYTDAFPDVVIGDIEPTSIVGMNPNWQEDLTDWAKAFRAETGKPLAFLHVDTVWNRPDAGEDLQKFFNTAIALKRMGLVEKVGMIYKGNRGDSADPAWTKHARNLMQLTEVKYQLHPDQAIIQSWMPCPTHIMPDSSPNTLSGLVNFYLSRQWRR